jgi:alkyldihydroxyacetonephosphate synthase
MYHTGVCIYFTHGFYHKGVEDPEEKFAAMEQKIRAAIMDAGGSISHHHGVGKLRKNFMERTMSPGGASVLRDIKRNVDPDNVFGVRNNVLAE